MKHQTGFTLIELVIVIVLLGVLSAIAIPRFVNLEDEAQAAALNANVSAITSAMNINYAACAVNNHTAGGDCAAVSNCNQAGAVLSGGVPAGYSVANVALPTGNGSTADCVLTQTATGATDTFTAVRAGT